MLRLLNSWEDLLTFFGEGKLRENTGTLHFGREIILNICVNYHYYYGTSYIYFWSLNHKSPDFQEQGCLKDTFCYVTKECANDKT